jgi:hypothetical protein
MCSHGVTDTQEHDHKADRNVKAEVYVNPPGHGVMMIFQLNVNRRLGFS